MANVIEVVKIGRRVPKELEGFDAIAVVEDSTTELYGMKGGRRRKKLGAVAVAAALKLTGKSVLKNRQSPRPAKPPATELRSSGGSGELTRRLEDLESQFGEVRQTNEKLSTENEALKTQNTELLARLDRLDTRLNKVLGLNKELDDKNKDLEAKNQDLEERLQSYEAGDLAVVYEPKTTDSKSQFKRSINKTTGWVGSKVPWGGEPAITSSRIDRRDDKPVVVVEREVVDGYSETDRRRGAAALLGTVAVLGASLLMAGLWGEHEENEGKQSQSTKIEQNFNNHTSMGSGRNAADDARDKAQNEGLSWLRGRVDKQSRVNAKLKERLAQLEQEEAQEKIGGTEEAAGTHTESLSHSGDTIWEHVEDDLEAEVGHEPSAPLVRNVTDRVLKMNHLRWQGGGWGVDTHKLPVGYEFQVPNGID